MASKLSVTFVTGNQNKLKEMQEILGDGIELKCKAIDLPELQGEPEYIVLEKCKLAMKEIEGPVIVEDTSLCFNALHGLPGPYIKWFFDKLGCDGLNQILSGYEDKSASALCAIAYYGGDNLKPVVVVGKTNGRIVPPRGSGNFGWDPIFEPEGFDKTYAEMEPNVKRNESHKRHAIEKLLEVLQDERK